jgi:DNA-binding NtrC family response regulator
LAAAKVIIVDDEMEFASTLSERLILRNYDAKAVYCAEDAFAIARNNPPDVVLLDMKMPGMSGIEICTIIKQFNPFIQVIMLTGESESEIMPEIADKEVFDYVMKPVDIEELTGKIDSALKKATEIKQMDKHDSR